MSKVSQLKEVTVYTDGACSGNPGPGGWGAVLLCDGAKKELSGGERSTTNNRMELMAAISALEALRFPCRVRLHTDSKYVCDAMTKGWAARWRENGWMRNKKDAALNPDLWERLMKLCVLHQVDFIWVRGHADDEMNNLCDRLAVAESKKFK